MRDKQEFDWWFTPPSDPTPTTCSPLHRFPLLLLTTQHDETNLIADSEATCSTHTNFASIFLTNSIRLPLFNLFYFFVHILPPPLEWRQNATGAFTLLVALRCTCPEQRLTHPPPFFVPHPEGLRPLWSSNIACGASTFADLTTNNPPSPDWWSTI
jgi:hypothetical protein